MRFLRTMRRRMAPRRHCHPGVAALSNAKPRSATRSTFQRLGPSGTVTPLAFFRWNRTLAGRRRDGSA